MSKDSGVHKGDDVSWKWGKGNAEGEVVQVHTKDVEKTIKGKTITRHASKDDPAVEVKTAKGATALKSASEVKVKK